jgi:hypothetical protein
VCLAPVHKAAAAEPATLEITEVMYNAPGSDQGAEWVEITDTGSSSVNISSFKFFQGGVNHGIVAVSGGSTLAAGESAIIADDAQKFATDYPAYSGPLFKSSFSLLNTGGALAIKNASSTVLDSVTYSSSMGAAGDGNSLHRVGTPPAGGFVAGAPNPGSDAPAKPIIKTTPAPSSTSPSSTSAKKLSSATSTQYTFASADEPAPPASGTALWWYVLGLGALVALAVAGVLYARTGLPAGAETSPSADEFDIE